MMQSALMQICKRIVNTQNRGTHGVSSLILSYNRVRLSEKLSPICWCEYVTYNKVKVCHKSLIADKRMRKPTA